MQDDPFGTAAIRHGVLQAWRLSTTRLAEDAATESDLVEIGYRDRLFTELAANAADAAIDGSGELAVWIDSDGAMHVANTGVPLDVSGVAALSAVRVSSKPSGAAASASVGRFGVGFSAVVAVGVEVAIRSRHGGVVFGADRTVSALVDAGVPPPPGSVPMLRLPFPDDTAPADGFDTEVVITPRPDVDIDEVMTGILAEIDTLLLELTALRAITHADRRIERITTIADGVRTVAIDERTWTEVRTQRARWLMPGGPGAAHPVSGGVLHAPTRTDVDLTLPAVCIADVALTPDRRGLHPGADIASVAVDYHLLACALEPSQRLAVVPRPGFAAGRADGELRAAIVDDLNSSEWLPTADDDVVAPERAVVVAGLTDALGALLAEVLAGLVHPDLSDPSSMRLLTSLRVEQMSLAEVCERLAGLDREPRWWASLYEALTPLIVDDRAAGEIAAIPVPRADGRLVIGARGLVLPDRRITGSTEPPPISWLPTVHPDAAHELLERLGARPMTVTEMVADPALRSAIDSDEFASDGTRDAHELTEEVLGLLAADGDAVTPDWLGGLLVADDAGELRPADELLLPDSPIASVLASDSPFGIVATDTMARHGPEVLRRIGVGWGFTLVTDEYPAGPDHDLPDEDLWWRSLQTEPQQMEAVRDLDLVDPDRWPVALSLLAGDPDVEAALRDRRGYTAWWLRTFVEMDGRPLGHFRAPDDTTSVGLLDPIDHPDADRFAAALSGNEIESNEYAALILRRLGDPDRVITPGVAAAAYSALVTAHRRHVIDLDRLDVPVAVRTLAGVTSETAVVLDRPWLVQVVAAAEAVITSPPIDPDAAAVLATVLDIPTAGEEYETEILDTGTPTTWGESPSALAAAVMAGIPADGGVVVVHDRLPIAVTRGGERTVVEVTWWVDDAGVRHLVAPTTSPRG